ncbi:sensor histidine kinase [bacterium]
MSLFFWIDFACLIISLIISTSLVLNVLGTGSKRPENQAFAFFSILMLLWNISAILLRFSLLMQNKMWQIPVGPNSEIWFRFTAIFIASMLIMSLNFSVVFLKIRASRINLFMLIGFLLMLILNLKIIPQFIRNVRFNQLGLITDDIKPFGWVVILFYLSYLFTAMILFWKHRSQQGSMYIGYGFMIIFCGVFFGGALNLTFPPMSIFNTLGLSIIGYAIIRLQVLNPVKSLNKELQALLDEKDILLKEIHHRVKNNMQLIESLLNIESNKTQNKEAIDILKSSKNRIRSIAMIHERLYRSDRFTEINFQSYASYLIKHLNQSYSLSSNQIQYHIDIEEVIIPIDIAVPCGLILNELITNAIKHAFPEPCNRHPEMIVSIHQFEHNHYEMIVQDNGQGFQKEIDIDNTETFGLSSIKLLVEHQLNGKLSYDSTPQGTKFSIKFLIEDSDLR